MQQDPIADMLTRIRNAQSVGKKYVSMPFSKIKAAVALVLKKEGYILDYLSKDQKGLKISLLEIQLKYFDNRPVISHVQRVSRPSLRVYKGKNALPVINSGLGISIISTSKGVMSNKLARSLSLGGEVLCHVT